MLKDKIKQSLDKVLTDLGLPQTEIKLDFPEDFSHGAYTTNVAMMLAKQVEEKPIELAEKIVGKLRSNLPDGVSEVKVAPPGFINFFLTPEFLASVVSEINKDGKSYGQNKSRADEKVMVEYTQPNPFKEFHIGHMVNNIVGEALATLIAGTGAEVKRVTYHGDVGMHVAKTIWGLQSLKLNVESEKLTIKELGEAYATGDKAFVEDEQAKKEITEINKKVYERSDDEINKLYDLGKKVSLDHFEEIYKRLGSNFDHHFFESETGKIGLELVKENIGKVFEKGESGAIIFAGENHCLHTRVFINSEGLPTYEAKDLGLVKLKKDFYSFDTSITVTDVEQSNYFTVVKKAMELVFPELASKIKHVTHGRLRLSTGRMSSRTGTIISADTLLGSLKEAARGSEAVAIGAIKYAILRQAPGKNIIFDMEKSLSLEGDSGPYLQYALVRAKAVLKKAQDNDLHQLSENGSAEFVHGPLEQLLLQYPDVVARAQADLAPQHLVTYLTALASAFNTFYAKETIVEDSPASVYRILLTQAVAHVLSSGLSLLAIPTPEKM